MANDPTSDVELPAELAQITDRLEAEERELEAVADGIADAGRQIDRLKATLKGVAKEAGVSVDGRCGNCDESFLIIKGDSIYCPKCNYGESL